MNLLRTGTDGSVIGVSCPDPHGLSLRDAWGAARVAVEGLPEFVSLTAIHLEALPGDRVGLDAEWGMGFSFSTVLAKDAPDA